MSIRTYSTGFERSKLRTYLELLRHHRDATRFSRESVDFFVRSRAALERGHGSVAGMQILDVGCGQRFTTTLLFNSIGASCIGIDTDVVTPRFGPRAFIDTWRHNGAERAIKTLGRRLIFDRRYLRELERALGMPLVRAGLDLRAMDVCSLGFENETFDGAVSTNVFEHVHDVKAATAELTRVLRPGGIAVINVCLFPALPGGHHYEWSDPDQARERTVPPWDHLRENQYPTQAYLNHLRISDYHCIFSSYLEVVDVTRRRHTDRYLTVELRRELSDFTEEDLLTPSMEWVLRKRGPRAV